jgi:Glycosyl hydrolase family 62/Cellulose binding domain
MIARRTQVLLAAVVAALLALTISVVNTAQAQAAGCSVSYTVSNQWPGGFTANVSVTNLGSPLSGWRLTWSFTAGQRVEHGWNAAFPATGPQVEARNAAWNADLGTGGSASFGFNGSWNNLDNPVPASFALNGTTCTGGTTTPPTSQPPTSPPPQQGGLPSSFQWSSSGPLAGPMQVDPSRTFVSVKDFSVVRHNNRWLIYGTTASSAGGWSLVHYSFADWPQAASAPQTQLDIASDIGPGYRAAPQLFFFAPQNLWYLVYQSPLPTYSTSTNPSDPTSWSAPRFFMTSEPPILVQNKGSGGWLDFWVVCDSANCYLFFSDLNGHLYRAQTSLANFPNGFGNTAIVLTDPNRFPLWEASNVYRVQGQNQYLLLVEAIGSDGNRWFRSWTSTSIAGSWTPLAATEANPFARSNNVTFPGGWSRDVSHGDMVRVNNDQTQTINPCDLQYVYQGRAPSSDGLPYVQLPYRMGLLTQTNSTC